AGQALARLIPNQHLRIGADNVCRDDQVLHEAHGEAVVLDCHRRSKSLPIVVSGHGNDEEQKRVKRALTRIAPEFIRDLSKRNNTTFVIVGAGSPIHIDWDPTNEAIRSIRGAMLRPESLPGVLRKPHQCVALALLP
ncbi:MAG: hypothetical protein P4L81_06280, partial [Candidatus Pacebacteria bacterium]|nr:hypothetical protein [Candidatus Paceibacterota bacterium]